MADLLWDRPDRCYVIIARNRGGKKGQALLPCSSYQCFVFNLITKIVLLTPGVKATLLS